METSITALSRIQRNLRRLMSGDLSAKLGNSPQVLSGIESGKRNLR
jgi:hypothetical protein